MTPEGPKDLFVTLFGGPMVVTLSGDNVPLTPYQAAAVAYVVSRGSVTREALAGVLWGRDLDSNCRQRLRQLLHSIRRRAPTLVETSGERVARSTVTASDMDLLVAETGPERLRGCAELVQLGFLSRLPYVSSSYERWVDEFGMSVRHEVMKSALKEWRAANGDGRWRDALECAEALYSLDDRDAKNVCRVVQARARLGRTSDAVGAFEVFAATGADPADLSTVQAAVESAREANRMGRSTAGETGEPFVGRRRELSVLAETSRRVLEGRSAFALVTGEPGIGKTRLLREGRLHAALDGARTLTATATEPERRIPLNVMLDGLGGLKLDAHLQNLGEPWRSVVASTLPPGALEAPPSRPPPTADRNLPRRLMEAYALLLESIATERPTVIFLDDLHWADDTSVTLLHFFLRRWKHVPLGVVASCRMHEVDRASALWSFLDRPPCAVQRVALSELSDSESQELVAQLASDEADPMTIAQLLALGGNHPMYLTELARDYESGRVRSEGGSTTDGLVPVSLRHILARRWRDCSDHAIGVAQLLAVAGRPIPIGSLSDILDMSLEETISAVEELRAARLVTASEDSVTIAHDLFRSAIYEDQGNVRQTVLHRALALYLSKSDPSATSGELAMHFDRAGARGDAFQFARAAAARSMEHGAVAEAAHLYQLAAKNAPLPEAMAEATAGYATAFYLARSMRRAVPALELAASRLRACGEDLRARRMDVLRVEGLAETGATTLDDLLARWSSLKAEARCAGDWEALALALDQELRLVLLDERFDAVRSICRQCRDVPGSHLAATAIASGALAVGLLLDDPVGAVAAAEAAVRLTLDSPLDERLKVLNRALIVLHHRGHFHQPGTQKLVQEALDISPTSGDMLQRFSLESNLGVAHLDVGALDSAAVHFRSAKGLLGRCEMTFPRVNLACNLGELALAHGEYDAAQRAFSSVESLTGEARPRYARDLVTAGLGLCALEKGALGLARSLENQLGPAPSTWYYDPFLVVRFRSRLQERRGDPAAAAATIADGEEEVKGRLVPAWLKLRLARVRLSARMGVPGARQLAEEGRAMAESLGLHVRSQEFAGIERGTHRT